MTLDKIIKFTRTHKERKRIKRLLKRLNKIETLIVDHERGVYKYNFTNGKIEMLINLKKYTITDISLYIIKPYVVVVYATDNKGNLHSFEDFSNFNNTELFTEVMLKLIKKYEKGRYIDDLFL